MTNLLYFLVFLARLLRNVVQRGIFFYILLVMAIFLVILLVRLGII